MAVGVARPIAQGQAITRMDVKILRAKENSAPVRSQTTKAITATAITIGTNIPATLSATFEMGAFLPCASSINLMIFESVVSSPTRVISMKRAPLTSILPPIASLPAAFSTGILSPVSIASLTLPSPFVTIPSRGIFAPDFTRTKSPTLMVSVGTSHCLSSRISIAVSGVSSISFVIALFVFS